MNRIILLISLSIAAQSATSGCPSWSTTDRFFLADSEVVDKFSGLIWKRCAEGQTWSGSTCGGIAIAHTHEQALASAKVANPGGSSTGWRLPNVKELAGIADKGCNGVAIDNTAFPATPSSTFWSSSPYVGEPDYAWVVNFLYGGVDGLWRNSIGAVRLVRSSE